MPEIWEGKKYKNTETEGFDDFMKALGKFVNLSFSVALTQSYSNLIFGESKTFFFRRLRLCVYALSRTILKRV